LWRPVHAVRKPDLIVWPRNNGDEDVIPIARQLVDRVVIGKTPGRRPATVQVHGMICRPVSIRACGFNRQNRDGPLRR
jgi:hypothetical protein